MFSALPAIVLVLIAIAWCRKDRRPLELSILTLSAVLLTVSEVRAWKLALIVPDYSSRLGATIGTNILVALSLGIYLGIKRRWVATIAALILAYVWLMVLAINAAV